MDVGFRGAEEGMGCWWLGEFEVTADWWAKGGYAGYRLERLRTKDDGWKSWAFGRGGGEDKGIEPPERNGWPGKGISHCSPRNPFSATCGLAVWNGTAGAAADR